MNKQLVMALLASGAMVGLSGCSEGDEATIIIDAPTTDNSQTNSGNTTNNPQPAPEPEPEPEPEPDAECPTGTSENADGMCVLPSTVSTDLTLDASFDYLMEGRVTVGNGNGNILADGTLEGGDTVQNVTLTIPAGTKIYGKTGTFANLLITRGSKIMAMGTADAPIIMSSDDAGYEGAGEWGGLIIHGYGLHNTCAGADVCNVDAEGESGKAGGFVRDDNSGTLQYVVVAEGGYEFAPDNEINGISLVGVGSGTTMEYIQVEGNSDDGIEFYGGDVNLKYGVFTNNLDDSVDWDEGYQGNLQHIIVKQSNAGSGEAFEMDTQGAAEPLSKPTVANLTIVASKKADDASYVMRFKKGSGGFFHNVAVTTAENSLTTFDTCAAIEGSDSEGIVGSALVFNNWLYDCANAAGDNGSLASVGGLSGTAGNPDLDNNFAAQAAAAVTDEALDWAAINAAYPESVADADYLDSTRYIGAVNPLSSTLPWWAGWTIEGSLGTAPSAPEATCPAGAPANADGLCVLPSTIGADMTLNGGVDYLMEGRVTVGNGNGNIRADGKLESGSDVQNVTLTIEPGVKVYGKSGTFANLLITRGSKIMAEGTATAPIIFSSDDEGYEGAGEWGGLIIHGYGLHNTCTGADVCNVDAEGESGRAGGFVRDDNSGVLRYVVVAEGGYEFAPDNEINGISLVGVGSGTTMEYIQVEGNSDDGIEFYGGDVNVKYGVFTNNLDDSVDWDEGYQGNLQYIIVKQSNAGGGEAFEMDTQGAAEPLSKPTVANLTIVASKKADDAAYVMRFKKGSAGFFHNVVVAIADDSATTFTHCAEIEGADSQGEVGNALYFNNWVYDCANASDAQGLLVQDGFDASAGTINAVAAEGSLGQFYESLSAEASGLDPLDWTAINGSLPESVADETYLDSTDFAGAVDPDQSNLWWAGWTIPGSL